jgi:hypothetical protein
MDEDPSNEAYVLSLLKGYGADEAEAMDIKPAPNEGDWCDKYITWMDRGELPSDRSEARCITRMAKSFALVDGKLYKRTASGVLQRCVTIPQGRELLRDIHTGVCGHHAAPHTLVGSAFLQGFYWPTAVADASEIVRTCEGCQFYARKANLPAHILQTIPVTWPFAVWGLDIIGPLRHEDDAVTEKEGASLARARGGAQMARSGLGRPSPALDPPRALSGIHPGYRKEGSRQTPSRIPLYSY